jgi:hypothetical protein
MSVKITTQSLQNNKRRTLKKLEILALCQTPIMTSLDEAYHHQRIMWNDLKRQLKQTENQRESL